MVFEFVVLAFQCGRDLSVDELKVLERMQVVLTCERLFSDSCGLVVTLDASTGLITASLEVSQRRRATRRLVTNKWFLIF